jgi:hypothetical protein
VTDTTPPVKAYTFPGVERRTALAGLRLAQVVALGVAVLVAIGCAMTLPSILGLALGLVALGGGAVVAFVRPGGRPVEDWIPGVARYGWLTATRRRQWRSPLPHMGRRPGQPPQAAPPPTLAGVTLLRATSEDGVEVGVAKDPRHGRYTAAVRVRSGAFALLPPEQQDQRTALWGQLLAAFAQEGLPVARVAWLERTLPPNAEPLEYHLAQHATLGPGDPAWDSYAELITTAGVHQPRECLIVLAVDTARALRTAAKTTKGDVAVCGVLLREVRTLADRLASIGVEVDVPVSCRQLAGVIRSAFDPHAALDLYHDNADGPVGTSGPMAWPMATTTAWDHYRTDTGVHATYWIGEWPRRPTTAGFLAPLLLGTTSVHTLAVVMEPVPATKAFRAAEAARASHLADDELRTRAGFLTTARRRRTHDSIEAREHELAAGHAEYRYAGYLTISAANLDDLDDACAQAERLAHDADLELRRLSGEQDIAFTNTLPLARGP